MTRPEEQAVLDAGLARGYFTEAQLALVQSRRALLEDSGKPTPILPLLSELLEPAQREQLRIVFHTLTASSAKTVRMGHGSSGQVNEAPDPGADSGELIGNYEVIRELGRGGMGVVYEARSTTLRKKVALKVLLKGAKGGDVDRFKVEGQAVARLRHPNLVGILEQGQADNGEWYMAMDLVEGEPMIDRLARGPIPPREAAEQAFLLAEALAYAHEKQVLHRDLKPHNVLLEADGTPKLTDFGLAKLTGGDRGNTLTRTGEILGTPCYMAPEQICGERGRIDERTDVYGLGATIYHMLTGAVPFEARSVTTVFVKIINDTPRPLREAVPEIPKDLETIVLKCLEKDPGQRYPGARALARDLNRFLGDFDIVAQRVSGVRRATRWARRNRAVMGVLAGTLGLLTLVGGYAANEVSSAHAENGRLIAQRALEAKQKEAELARVREELAQSTLIEESEDVDVLTSGVDQPSSKTEPERAGDPLKKTDIGGLLDRVAEAPPLRRELEAPKRSPHTPQHTELPEWLVARGKRGLGSSRVVLAASLGDAQAEAAARNVPVVVVATDAASTEKPSVFNYANAIRLLRDGGVVVVAGPFHVRQSQAPTQAFDDGFPRGADMDAPPDQAGAGDGKRQGPDDRQTRDGSTQPGGPPPQRGGPPPRRGGPSSGGRPPRMRQAGPDDRRMQWSPEDPCPVFPSITCRAHMNVSKELSRLGVFLKAPTQGKARLHLLKPDGTGPKTLRSATTKSLRTGLGYMQRKLGKVQVEAQVLDRLALLLTRGEPKNLRALRARVSGLRSGASLPAPVGPLVRAEVLKLCAQGIGFVSKSPHSSAKKRALFAALQEEFATHPECLARLDKAIEQNTRDD